MTKETFKEAIKIFADEFNHYFDLNGQALVDLNAIYSGKAVVASVKKQMNNDFNSFVSFINSRLNDSVLDDMEKEGRLDSKS